jgi:hypothetical protein
MSILNGITVQLGMASNGLEVANTFGKTLNHLESKGKCSLDDI